MPDSRPGHTPIDVDKLRTIRVGRRRETTVSEGREHPETGRPWKTTTTDAGSVTEHATKDDRVDAVARVETIRAVRNPNTGRITNVP